MLSNLSTKADSMYSTNPLVTFMEEKSTKKFCLPSVLGKSLKISSNNVENLVFFHLEVIVLGTFKEIMINPFFKYDSTSFKRASLLDRIIKYR
jgi:hypothetical protein